MDELVSGYTSAWVVWIIAFVGIEGAALIRKDKGDTLSEHVWKWFQIGNKPKGWNFRRLSLLAGTGWLLLHFVWRV